ncbi:RNase adapter RapZ [Corynebacterium neomassiliense]|uniref:RNase adapter RapZ n=1 Tax=Corynebacterium neomassiliense TaxID=2079482 RepID=UPI003B016809
MGSLTEVLAGLHDSGRRPVVLYLDADDATLVRRYGQLRRTHPLQDGETLQAGINREREMLEGIRQRADIVIDTTGTSVHDLRRQLEDYFTALSDRREHVTVQSFGFKNGAPRDLDLMFDARFLPNPYWEPELREHSGLEAAVADYVLDRPEARDYLDAVQGVVCGRPAVRGVRGRPGTRKVGTAGRIRSFFTFRTPRRRRASTRCNGGGPWRAQSGADCTSPTCDVHVTAATVSPRRKTGRYPCVAKMARHGHIRIRGTGLPRAAGYDRCRRSGRPGGPGTRRHRRSAGDQEGHGPAGVPP